MLMKRSLSHDISARVPAGTLSGRASDAAGLAIAGLARAIDTQMSLLLLGLFAVALMMVFISVPWGQNADDLLPTLISVQKLTVYFWGENRFANLLPLLTAWIASPARNAEAQLVLRVAAGLAAPAFFCALFYDRASHVWRATFAADCLMLLAASPAVLHETYIVATPYGASFACAAFALLASRRAWRMKPGFRRAALLAFGTVSLLAAHLVNYALGVIAIPLIGILLVARPSEARGRFLMLNLMAMAIAFLAPSVFAPEYFTRLGLAPSMDGLGGFATSVWDGTGWVFAACVVAPVAVASVLWAAIGRVRRGRAFAMFAAASVAAALVLFLVAGSSSHVALNSFNIRYAVPALLALLALGGIACWEALRLCWPARAMRSVMLMLVSILSLMLAHGRLAASGGGTPDIIGHGEAGLARAIAAEVAARNLDGVAGTYWHVWPAVFAAEETRHDSAVIRSAVIGVTQRGEARRGEFLALLASKGTLRLVCVDYSAARCLEEIDTVMDPPSAIVREFAAARLLPEGHELRFVEVTPAPAAP
jgi:hypothetical protein